MISYYADLVIGLVLAFLLLSLVVSGLNEGIVRMLAIRSKFLWAYLRDTLDGAEVDGRKVSAMLRAADGLLNRLKGVGRWLRGRLIDLLPPPEDGRSRLPTTVLGVFAALPFGNDPRPDFSPQPSPVQSPPLAPAPDTAAANMAAADTVGLVAVGADAVDPVLVGAVGAAGAAAMAAAGLVFDGDPAHGADQADEGERVVVDVAPAGAGKSMTELLHERLQEIDHATRGRTSISEIPPSRFAVAVMEIATEHGGVERLLGDLDALKSPLYRPLKAAWDRASKDVDAFRKCVEDWFDGEMERLTLLYRRYVRWVIALLSLAVTLVFSMDALEYGKTLLEDSAYRSAVSAFADSGPEALAPIKKKCEANEETYACVTDVLSTPGFVQIFSHAPVGATIQADSSPSWAWRAGDWWDRLSSPGHWPGFLITLVALLFGAPFWWDVLRRVTGIKARLGGGK